MAQHEYERSADAAIVWPKEAAECRPHPENVKEVRRRDERAERNCTIAIHVGRRLCTHVIDASDAGESVRVSCELGQIGEWHVEMRAGMIERMQYKQAILLGKREPIGDHGLEDREHRRRHADAEREDRHGGDREGGSSPQGTECNASVAAKV